MSSSYDGIATPMASSSNAHRRSFSSNHERTPHLTPPEARRSHYSSSYDYYSHRASNYYSDPYRQYQRAPSPGVYERYRDMPNDLSWNKPTSWYPPRDNYDPGHQEPSVRDRGERVRSDSNSSTVSRTFEPSESWKNGARERDDRNGKEYNASPERYPSAGSAGRRYVRDGDGYTSKASWPPSASSYNQERTYTRESYPDYRSRAVDSFSPHHNGYQRASHSSSSHSPRRHYRSRSRSHSRSRSRSRSSRSRSISRSISRSRSPPAKRSRLPVRDLDSEASAAGALSRYRYQVNSTGTQLSPRIPTGPRRLNVDIRSHTRREKSKSKSPSASHSSIASSRETSVKPSASRSVDAVKKANGERIDTEPANDLTSMAKSNTSPLGLLPGITPTYSIGSASELLSEILRTTQADAKRDTSASNIVKADTASQPRLVHPLPPKPTTTVSSFQRSTESGAAVPKHSVQEAPEPVSTSSSSDAQVSSETVHEAAGELVITTPRDPVAAPPPLTDTLSAHPVEIPDFSIEDIPDMSDAPTVRDAVRIVVMRRYLADRQTQQNRVDPVLFSNLSIAKTEVEESLPNADIQALMTDMTHPESDRYKSRMETANKLRGSLVERFNEQQRALKEKVQRLREEYIQLHDKWMVHCAALDRQAKAKSDAQVADAKAAPVAVAPPPITGRTTRRTAATLGLGDAVRSDLEMEQIIANIGSSEATDPNQLCLRNVATIPDMISVTKGKVDYVYDDNNLRVDDPVTYYAPQSGLNDWTEEEKQIFVDKFAIFPKQFGAISRFLPSKTTAQCVDFYYLHKNVDIDFRKIVAMNAPGRRGKRRPAKRKANALLADIRKHDAEVAQDSATGRAPARGGRAKRGAALSATPVATVPVPALPELRKPSSRRTAVQLEGTPTTATPTPEPESRPKRRRIATSRVSLGAAQTDADEDVVEEPKPAKKPRRGGRKVKSAAIVSEDVPEDTLTPPPLVDPKVVESEAAARARVGIDWSEEEKKLFLNLLGQYGDDFKRIASSMPNKTIVQVNNFYKTNETSLDLAKIVDSAPKRSSGSPALTINSILQLATPDGLPSSSSAPSGSITTSLSVPTYATGATAIPGDISALYSHSGFPRYTTGVSPYGAPQQGSVPISSLYTAQLYPPHGFSYPTAAAAAAAGATGLTPYAPSTAFPGARPYIPYPFSYQAGYPQMGMTGPPTSTPTASGSQTPYTQPSNTTARPYYPYS